MHGHISLLLNSYKIDVSFGLQILTGLCFSRERFSPNILINCMLVVVFYKKQRYGVLCFTGMKLKRRIVFDWNERRITDSVEWKERRITDTDWDYL